MKLPSKAWFLDAGERVALSFAWAFIGVLTLTDSTAVNLSTVHAAEAAGIAAALSAVKSIVAGLIPATLSPASLLPKPKRTRTTNGSHPTRKTGRRKPSGRFMLPISAYLTPAAFTLPPHPIVDFLTRFKGWLMLGNDVAGDCVAVSIANMRALVSTVLAGVTHYPSQDAVWTFYQTQNPKFDPNGGTKTNGPGSKYDAGMDEATAINDLVTIGIDGVKAIAGGEVDHTNMDELRATINVLGCVILGIVVTQANQSEFENHAAWDYVAGSPEDGGHGVVSGGHEDAASNDLRFITWADETTLTEAFEQYQVEEAHWVVWPEHLGTTEFQAGIDYAGLAADVQAMFGVVLPSAPTPTPAPPVTVLSTADIALIKAATPWVAAKHSGTNLTMQKALRAWMESVGAESAGRHRA